MDRAEKRLARELRKEGDALDAGALRGALDEVRASGGHVSGGAGAVLHRGDSELMHLLEAERRRLWMSAEERFAEDELASEAAPEAAAELVEALAAAAAQEAGAAGRARERVDAHARRVATLARGQAEEVTPRVAALELRIHVASRLATAAQAARGAVGKDEDGGASRLGAAADELSDAICAAASVRLEQDVIASAEAVLQQLIEHEARSRNATADASSSGLRTDSAALDAPEQPTANPLGSAAGFSDPPTRPAGAAELL